MSLEVAAQVTVSSRALGLSTLSVAARTITVCAVDQAPVAKSSCRDVPQLVPLVLSARPVAGVRLTRTGSDGSVFSTTVKVAVSVWSASSTALSLGCAVVTPGAVTSSSVTVTIRSAGSRSV